ncbi:gluconolaconase [Novosphingobium lentum]|uniref:gluconolaconase n=1 Tax=Novosphingobium lentum TaxID=145287 RepID=UPI000B276C06|nr:gluconolaconase [Novosphingobium lentum]
MSRDRLGQPSANPPAAPGRRIETLVGPAALIGANGMRWGPDGRLYVAQAFGGQVSAVDLTSGIAEVISGAGGAIVAPDDLAFDSHGNLFITEVMSARVSAIRPNGKIEVIAGDVPVANGVTVHGDRIFMSEFNPEGRIWELYADGSPPRLIASNLMMPNALCLGPDGMLYFPLVPLGEVWRVALENGVPEKVVGGLDIPTAVKWDAAGRLFVVESGSGKVTRIDPATGRTSELARVAFGIDNLAFAPDGRMFVSHFTDGGVVEIAPDGQQRQAVTGGLCGPFGMACDAAGKLVVADGMSFAMIDGAGTVERPAMLLHHGFPGYVRGAAVAGDGAILSTNSAGQVTRFVPGSEAVALLEGLDQAMGLACAADGTVIVCEAGAGRVLSIAPDGSVSTLASGLDRPTGVHVNADGSAIVSEAGAGRVLHLTPGEQSVVLDGLSDPHGVTAANGTIYALDRGTGQLHAIAGDGSANSVVATGLPVGAHSGMKINVLPGIAGLMPGPLLPFADIAALPDGRIAIGGDETGSLLTIAGL